MKERHDGAAASGGRVGRWRTEAGRQTYEAAYAEALAQMHGLRRSLDIETSYGTVKVYEHGTGVESGARPAVLLPGRSSGAPMWRMNIGALLADRTVYTLDALGDAGLSVQTRPLRDAGDQAAWLDEVLDRLRLEQLHLIGHSFGGWSAANYAMHHLQRLATLVLLEPVFVFQGLRARIYLAAMIASMPFLPRSWRRRQLAMIGGQDEVDESDALAAMIAAATDHFVARLPVPKRMTNEQLQGLRVPAYAALAEASALHDGAAAAEVASRELPDAVVKLWPGTTHSLPMEVPDEIGAEIGAFLRQHDPRAQPGVSTVDDNPDDDRNERGEP